MSGKTYLSKSDLQLIATKLGIEARPEMKKAELIEAIRAISSSSSKPGRKPPDDHYGSRFTRASVVNCVISIIALIISLFSVIYTRQQTLIRERELDIQEQKYHAEMTAEWDELRQVMLDILDSAPLGIDMLTTLSRQEKLEWIRQQEKLLNSQADNPVLISDELSLGYWRNAMASARTTRMVLEIESVDSETADSLFVASANSIFKDIGFAWERLVLESNQVSPTGGRPGAEDR